MPSIKNAANTYEGSLTRNVADLAEVNVDEQINEATRKDNEGTEYKVLLLKRDNQEYRVPAVVLKQLKAILEKKPDLKKFSVAKTGEGMNTTYTVIPM